VWIIRSPRIFDGDLDEAFGQVAEAMDPGPFLTAACAPKAADRPQSPPSRFIRWSGPNQAPGKPLPLV
jgi:hypothetical protein